MSVEKYSERMCSCQGQITEKHGKNKGRRGTEPFTEPRFPKKHLWRGDGKWWEIRGLWLVFVEVLFCYENLILRVVICGL